MAIKGPTHETAKFLHPCDILKYTNRTKLSFNITHQISKKKNVKIVIAHILYTQCQTSLSS